MARTVRHVGASGRRVPNPFGHQITRHELLVLFSHPGKTGQLPPPILPNKCIKRTQPGCKHALFVALVL